MTAARAARQKGLAPALAAAIAALLVLGTGAGPDDDERAPRGEGPAGDEAAGAGSPDGPSLAALRREVDKERRRIERREKLNRAAAASRIRRDIRRIGSLQTGERLEGMRNLVEAGPRALPFLFRSLQSHNGYEVRYAGLTLGRMGDPDAVDALIGLATDDRTTPAGRFYAVGSLAAIGSAKAKAFFLEALDDSNEALRLAAAVGLRRVADREMIERLAADLGAGGESARQQAAREVLERVRRDVVARRRAEGRPLPEEEGGAGGGGTPGMRFEEEKPPAERDAELIAFFGRLEADEPLAAPRAELQDYPASDFVVTSDLPAEEALRIGLEVRRFRGSLCRWFRVRSDELEPTQVRLFARKADFDDYGATHDFNFRFFTEYYYSFLLREVVAYDGANPDLRSRRLRHEVVHDVLERSCGDAPRWLHEGVAECFEVARERPDVDGLDPEAVNYEWLALAKEAFEGPGDPSIRIADLLSIPNDDFYRGDQALHYAASWALVHTLANGPAGEEGRKHLREVVNTLRAGRGTAKANRLFSGDFSPERCEAMIREHLATLR